MTPFHVYLLLPIVAGGLWVKARFWPWPEDAALPALSPADHAALRNRLLWARDRSRAGTRPAELTAHLDAALALLDGRDET